MNDPNLHLFADNKELNHYTNVMRSINKPRKLEEPVLVSDKPWEKGCRLAAWGSVVREKSGLFRMWYFSFNGARHPETKSNGGYCYAESTDGIHWEKPPLNLYEWNGSTENNYFFQFGKGEAMELAARGEGITGYDRHGNVTGILNNMDGLTVVRDDYDENPDRRYKLIANMQDHRMFAYAYPEAYPGVSYEESMSYWKEPFGQYVMTSPDGIIWDGKPVKVKGNCNGDYMMVTKDERNKRWWLNERPYSDSARNAGLNISDDIYRWDNPTENIFFNDETTGFGRIHEWHAGMTPFNYGGQNLGFLEVWSNLGFGSGFELISQREGDEWKRVVPGVNFFETGPEKSFDRLLAYPLHNAPIIMGDEIYIYYNGIPGPEGKYADVTGGVGLAVIGLDRFVAFTHQRYDPGIVLTKVIEPATDILQINMEPFSGGYVKVAVKDAENKDIPGYTLDDCIPIEKNCYRGQVRWNGHNDLNELRGKKIRLRFIIHGAALYSYRWA